MSIQKPPLNPLISSPDSNEIVARIAKSPKEEIEHAIVHNNRELIRLYEEKVKKVIPARGRCERVRLR